MTIARHIMSFQRRSSFLRKDAPRTALASRQAISVIADLFGLDGEAQSYLSRAIKNLKQVIAGQATILAPSAGD
jgi:hypothetical protein